MRNADVRAPATSKQPRDESGRVSAPAGQLLGSLIGGVFGLVYIELNVGALPQPWPVVLRIAAAVVFAGLAILLLARRRPFGQLGQGGPGGFGTRYWIVVVGEVAAIPAGAALIRGPAGLPDAVVAWVSVVVGVHFIVLAAVWQRTMFRYLGVAISVCGVAGLVIAAAGAPTAAIAMTGGALPGMLLLIAAYRGATWSGAQTG